MFLIIPAEKVREKLVDSVLQNIELEILEAVKRREHALLYNFPVPPEVLSALNTRGYTTVTVGTSSVLINFYPG